MFDSILRDDLLSLNKGLDNINDLKFRKEEIKKIVIHRTQDKIWLIKQLRNEDVIDSDYYQELYNRIKNDFDKANLYLLGWCNI